MSNETIFVGHEGIKLVDFFLVLVIHPSLKIVQVLKKGLKGQTLLFIKGDPK